MPYIAYLLTLGLVIGLVLLFNGGWFLGVFVLLPVVMLTRRLAGRGGDGSPPPPSD
ncbi:hypothetical protein [Alkalilimnicola sp. S0819]|uniref:hypothetical protein n=1 Tax=Alkalilimnicola sp. S0819 TaxID=2613922 RepID=UPI001869ADE3|nr:hypothetical protein [Alkalilimnicola sp. S0819]